MGGVDTQRSGEEGVVKVLELRDACSRLRSLWTRGGYIWVAVVFDSRAKECKLR